MSRTAARQRLKLDDFVPYRLSVLTNTVSTAIAGAYADRFGLSIPEWRVMAVLALEPGLSAAEVAERTAMDKVAVSRAVSHLLRTKRVVRAFADADRRRSVLRLSAEGEGVYRRVVPFALRYEERLLADLTDAQREQLKQLLDHLHERAVALGPVRPEPAGLLQRTTQAATSGLKRP
jgi:DNA-binding MarR family transcriptional regulator